MENNDFIRRTEDLWERCERSQTVTNTRFLTPAESYELDNRSKRAGYRIAFRGGREECERVAAFFLPEWMDETALDVTEYVTVIRIKAYFGEPGHRDYMGALLNMGVNRECVGDIWVHGDEADIFCMKSVAQHLLSLERVGRFSVKCTEITPEQATAPERRVKQVSFSVMSPRLDAVASGMFDLSRTECARQIELGSVSLNYTVCQKTDAQVREGDIISLRGKGKGTVTGFGGTSRKGRLFVNAEILK